MGILQNGGQPKYSQRQNYSQIGDYNASACGNGYAYRGGYHAPHAKAQPPPTPNRPQKNIQNQQKEQAAHKTKSSTVGPMAPKIAAPPQNQQVSGVRIKTPNTVQPPPLPAYQQQQNDAPQQYQQQGPPPQPHYNSKQLKKDLNEIFR
jgi:hypothetical protein